MLDAVQIRDAHQVMIGMSDHHNVPIDLQAPTTIQIVVCSHSVIGVTGEYGVVVSKRVLRVQGKIR